MQGWRERGILGVAKIRGCKFDHPSQRFSFSTQNRVRDLILQLTIVTALNDVLRHARNIESKFSRHENRFLLISLLKVVNPRSPGCQEQVSDPVFHGLT